ncbi:MAG: bi-domain-containing oxidoreductase [Candidatus Cloacimonetes bacterium]|nr:bi-domain-containing oxidoreductase [Candidatus Cloacimonadota bacterium]
MKQLIQSYKTGKMEVVEVPIPGCGNNGVLVETKASLVSAGTEKLMIDLAKKSLVGKAQARPDLVKQVMEKIKRDGLKPTLEKVFSKLDSPVALGYSCAGEVCMSGKNVKDIQPGDRVACAGAGYASHAEINFVPGNLVVKIPENVSYQQASFTTVAAIALQGVRQLNPTLGEKIAVIGAGLIGQITIQLLKANGCNVIAIDIAKAKLELAKEMGADAAVQNADMVEAVQEFTEGRGVDGVIITASTTSPSLMTSAGELCRIRGRVIIVGMFPIEIPRDLYYKKELECKLSMSYGPGRYDPSYEEGGIDYPYSFVRWTEQRNMEAILNLISQKKITPEKLISHVFDFTNVLEAYELLTGKKKEPYLGIVLEYSEIEYKKSTVELNAHNKSGSINLAVIGAGNFCQSVALPFLRKTDANLTALIDFDTSIATHIGKKFGFSQVSSDLNEILKDDSINTVMITTPHNTHTGLAIDCIKSGKNVFVEKPLAMNEEQLKKIKEIYEKSDVSILVGFNRRFSSHAKKIQEFMQNSGTPLVMNYLINAGAIPPEHWTQNLEIGGGRIIGEGCHFIDFMQSICQSDPIEVYAISVNTDDILYNNDDSVQITIKFADGSIGCITYHAVGDRSLPKEYFEASSGNKTAKMYNFYKTELYHDGKKTSYSSKGQNKGFLEEYSQFFNAIRNGKSSPIAFNDLYITTLTTIRAMESIKTGLALKI